MQCSPCAIFLTFGLALQVGFTLTLTFTIQKYFFDCSGVHNQLIATSYVRFERLRDNSNSNLKGHGHPILVHFKNQKYVLTSINAQK